MLLRAQNDAEGVFDLPLVFRREDDRRYELVTGRVWAGERILVLTARGAHLGPAVEAMGFTSRRVRGAAQLVALEGDASEAVAAELGATHIHFAARAPTLVPALLPALRKDKNGERLVYRAGRDIWLELRNGPAGAVLRAEVSSDDEPRGPRSVEVGEDDQGRTLVRVPSAALGAGVHDVRIFVAGRARALAGAEIFVELPAQEGKLARWHATLHPEGASVDHLREHQCWLDVDAIPGVDVEVEVRCGAEAHSVTLGPEDWSSLKTARHLREAAGHVLRDEDKEIERVEIRARATDEPEGWVTIATLGVSDAPLRFDVSGRAPVIVAPAPD